MSPVACGKREFNGIEVLVPVSTGMEKNNQTTKRKSLWNRPFLS